MDAKTYTLNYTAFFKGNRTTIDTVTVKGIPQAWSVIVEWAKMELIELPINYKFLVDMLHGDKRGAWYTGDDYTLLVCNNHVYVNYENGVLVTFEIKDVE